MDPIRLLRPLVKAVMRTCFQLEVRGLEHLPECGPVILAGNHTGWLDIPALVSAYHQPMEYLVTQWVLEQPVLGWVVRQGRILPVVPGREIRALKGAMARLNAGATVCIFPEGKLSETGALGHFHGGVALMHRKTQVPILPFTIQGGFEAWPWGRAWPRLHKITLTFMPPLPYREDRSDEELIFTLKNSIQEVLIPHLQKVSRNKNPETFPFPAPKNRNAPKTKSV